MRLLLLAALAALFTGCGYVGEPLPPATNLPAPVLDLTARQTGDRVELRFTLPTQTLEGLPITKPGGIELRVGAHPGAPFVTERWLAGSKELRLDWPADGLAVTHGLNAADWAGQDVVIGVRLANPKGRPGGFSNLVALHVAEPLPRPAELRFTESAAGVQLAWMAAARPGLRFRVYKREGGAKDPEAQLIATTEKPEYVDNAISYGRTYEYSVQSWLADEVVSVMSEVASITPKDIFPPAAPTGLTVIAGAKTVELAWDRATEFDFALYRVYRQVAEGEWVKVGETGANPSFSDRQLEAGKRHRYAVTAVDERGNESARSEPAEVTVD